MGKKVDAQFLGWFPKSLGWSVGPSTTHDLASWESNRHLPVGWDKRVRAGQTDGFWPRQYLNRCNILVTLAGSGNGAIHFANRRGLFRVRAKGRPNVHAAADFGFFNASLIRRTTALVAFSKAIPQTLMSARTTKEISRNIHTGCSRMRSPSQMT